MNSLRTRLIVGFALATLLPLALAMVMLGTRFQQTVRGEAELRLATAINVVQGELRDNGERLTARLALLARDPQLKRFYLVDSGSGGIELRQFLADQRFLLGLDYLAVADTAGLVRADAAGAPATRSQAGREAMAVDALPPARDSGLAVVALERAPALALDARAPIPYLDGRVGFVRGGLLLDSLFLARLQRSSGLELVLSDAAGRMLATTLKGSDAGSALVADGPAARGAQTGGAATSAARVVFAGHSYLTREVALGAGSGPAAHLTAFASTAAADEALSVLRTTAVLLGLLGLVLAVMLGVVWSHQLSRPVERLAAFSERISRGEWDEPLHMESMRELRTLVEALERMRSDLRLYRDQLRSSARQAAYGQMARSVAHEIKNPLTPIAISVAGLKRAYDQHQPDFAATLDEAVRTVGEEVGRLKHLLQEFSDLGRFPSPQLTHFDMTGLLIDLRTLYAHEVAAGRLAFAVPAGRLEWLADRDQLSQAIINLIQNALDAVSVDRGRVQVKAAVEGAWLRLTVSDDGPGLSEEQRTQLFVPGFTTKAQGSGLGLTIVERIVSDHGGSIEVESAKGRGTTFTLRLPREREA